MSPEPVPASSTRPPAISLRGVTKTYAIWDDPSARVFSALRAALGGTPRKGVKYFTAVQDISLEIPRGDCLGIIGRNGAGKSTLLQMIAGTVQPTSGEITVNGRVAALLELGSGFNPDFTGRENIHLNAAILGLKPAEIEAKFEAIVDYSGIREFIEQPVRTYSSGMSLRLAFAICVHVDAEILIIDEALAVGDARFQFKCHATLEQMIKEGRTVIFVSHDTNAVKRMCRTALLLERGQLLLQGSPNDVTNVYIKLITSPHGVESIREDLEKLRLQPSQPASPTLSTGAQAASQLDASLDQESSPSSSLLQEERAHKQISDREYAFGGELGLITQIELLDAHGQKRLSFLSGSEIRVVCRYRANATVTDPIYALTIKDVRGQEIFGTNTYFKDQPTSTVMAGTEVEATFRVQLNILPGVYFISLGWVRLENGEVQVIQRRYDALRLDVLPRDKSFGVAYCPTTIEMKGQP